MSDRVTELPKDIKQHILSSLSIRDAIATSSLSSPWRYIWVNLPSLDFGYHLFSSFSCYFDSLRKTHPLKDHLYSTFHPHQDDTEYMDVDDDDSDYYDRWENMHRMEIRNVAYIQLLDNLWRIYSKNSETPQHRRLCLYVPMLSEPNTRAYASRVVSLWLSLVNHNVEEFTYQIGHNTRDCVKDSFYVLKDCRPFLKSKTLTNLELDGCHLSSKNLHMENAPIHLPCLKRLVLGHFKVDQKMLDILLRTCVALETLGLSECRGFKVLRVSGLSQLKCLRVFNLHDLDRLEINAVPLQFFSLIGLYGSKCEVKVASNSCKNLVELAFNGSGIADDFFNNVTEFPRLEKLKLIDCPKLKRIKISSPSLEAARFEECPNLVHVELDTPKLFSFAYSGTGNIITLFSKCPINVSLHLKSSHGANVDHIPWHSKLVSLLANFRHAKYVYLSSNSKTSMIIPQELRGSFYPPLTGVRDLSLKVSKALTGDAVFQHLDTLLWFSPLPRSISLSSEKLKFDLYLMLQYEDSMKEGESCGCYPSQPINCWRRVLKDFQILRGKGLGNQDNIRKMLEDAFKKGKATSCG